MIEKEKTYLYWLCCCPHLGAVSIRKLYEYYHSFETIYNMEEREFTKNHLLKASQEKALQEWRSHISLCKEEYAKLTQRQIRFVTPWDEDYPKQLLNIADYPMGLFVKGRLPVKDHPSVAIVGARGCSAYGSQLAEEFACTLAREQIQIISGMALGIDSASHWGAIKASGATFGILGCGVDICYPASNYNLYESIIRTGGILSEFPLKTNPKARNFPMRNRIISGLADAILVVEAKAKSGSLITAETGLEQGREIFAVPGRITDYLSAGCNQLIQQGAEIATSPGDILEYLGIKYKKQLIIHEKNANSLAKKEKMLYSCLDFKPKHLDDIMDNCGLTLSECMSILLELELGGYVFRSANHYYGKKL
ncbi:DNA-processing protein DprA [Candidatus Ventrimonas sp. KK005]|nr:DNA-protecting protein DprA [Clostridiaceae bacterium]